MILLSQFVQVGDVVLDESTGTGFTGNWFTVTETSNCDNQHVHLNHFCYHVNQPLTVRTPQ